MQSSLNKLIMRANDLVERNVILECCIQNSELLNISDRLSVTLPIDFLKIAVEVSLDSFPSIQFWGVSKKCNEIVENNIELRKEYEKYSDGQSDMSHILVLADDDGGSVFMITQDSPEKPTPIIWCDYGDMYYYSIHKKFQNPHDKWPSFTAFFEYLVEQEEKKLDGD